MRRYHDFHQPPEDDMTECEWCGEESVKRNGEWLGNPVYDECTNEDCPGEEGQEFDEDDALMSVDLSMPPIRMIEVGTADPNVNVQIELEDKDGNKTIVYDSTQLDEDRPHSVTIYKGE